MSDLKRRMAQGAAWMVLFRFVDRGIGLIGTLILARLLVPGDFGLMAMAMTIIAALDLLGAYNFETALIQNRNAERSHYDTAFTLNLLLALLKALLMALLAHPAAVFYGEPRLEAVMLALAAASVLQGLENIGIVDFQKELQFDREFRLSLYRRLAGFVVTMVAAWWLGSYWALIIGITAMRAVGVALSFGMHPYRPRLTLQRWRELFGYTKWLLLNNVLIFLNNRGADFVIGRVSGSHALGLYSVSYELANLPTTELVHPIQRAMFPGYSQLADDPPRLRQTFLDVLGLIAILTVPIGLLIGALAEPFVLTLLGSQWVAAVPLVQLLSVFGVVRALHGPTGSIYLAMGRPRFIAYFALVQLCISLSLMLWLVPRHGAIGASWGILIGATAAMMVNYAMLSRQLSVSLSHVLAETWRPLLSGLLMYPVVHLVSQAWRPAFGPLSAAIELLCLGMLGLALHVALIWAAWRSSGRPSGAETTLAAELRKRLLAARLNAGRGQS
jgi:O-antigen/teichoic acid export membrane protein